jgi:hypothetical protein
MMTLLTAASVVLADSSDSNGTGIFALLASGPVAGVLYYRAIFRKYRNTDKSDQFERETRVAAKPVEGFDRKVDVIRGTQAKQIRGRNDADYRKRVQRLPASGPQG